MREDSLFKDGRFLLVCGVTLMVVLGVTSVTPTFPLVMKTFGVTAGAIGLVVTVFTVPGVVLTPVAGVLADRLGRRAILIPSLVVFGCFGLACAFAQSFTQLLVLRFFQGVGAAALGALNLTVLGDLYEGPRRTEALGLNAAVLAGGVAVYPVVGGLLASLDWRLPYGLPLLALPLAVAVWRGLPATEPTRAASWGDYFVGIGRGLQDRGVQGCFMAVFAAFVILYGVFMTYLPVHLDAAFSAAPAVIGALLSAAALLIGVASSQVGRLARVVSETRLILASLVLYALACAVMLILPGLYWYVIPTILLGLGQGLAMPCIMSVLAKRSPPAMRAAFMAANGAFLRLGQTVGPLLMAVFYSAGGMAAVAVAGTLLSLALWLTGAVYFFRRAGD